MSSLRVGDDWYEESKKSDDGDTVSAYMDSFYADSESGSTTEVTCNMQNLTQHYNNSMSIKTASGEVYNNACLPLKMTLNTSKNKIWSYT